MWYGHLARHRQDACATSFTSEMETLYLNQIDYLWIILLYGTSQSFIHICRGRASVPTPFVPTPDQSGQPRGDCPYKNIRIEIGLL
jgi:hypothetical protein